jgi:C1A family cysteine protease
VDQTCTRVRKKHYAYNWGQLYPNRFPNRNEIKRMVRKYGSVVTYMKAGVGSFYAYKSGVYNDYANTEENDVDHAVTIVGWSDKYNAWIIKNSWGTDWGYNGYAYVHYDHCNVGNYVYYVMPRHSFGRVSTPAPMAATPNGEEKPLVSDKSPIMQTSH